MDWTSPAPAKLNLCLNITGRRPDGYHELVSLAAFTAFGDKVSLCDDRPPGLSITGPFAAALNNDTGDNLIAKARQAIIKAGFRFRDHHITLHKHIPVSSGLGGGSSDVAAYLRCIAAMENMGPDDQERLFALGATIGADVPVCLRPGYQIMRGIGTEVEPVTIEEEPVFCVLANPGVPVSTKTVFAALGPAVSSEASLLTVSAEPFYLADILARGNDLFEPAAQACPQVRTLLDQMRQLGAQERVFGLAMSGSGASCFALTRDQFTADRLSLQLGTAGYWSVSTRLITNKALIF